jgi:chemotaxis protein histidine kinase CheA
MPRVLGEQDAGVGADGLAATTDKVTPNPAMGEDTDKELSAAALASKATPAAPAAPTSEAEEAEAAEEEEAPEEAEEAKAAEEVEAPEAAKAALEAAKAALASTVAPAAAPALEVAPAAAAASTAAEAALEAAEAAEADAEVAALEAAEAAEAAEALKAAPAPVAPASGAPAPPAAPAPAPAPAPKLLLEEHDFIEAVRNQHKELPLCQALVEKYNLVSGLDKLRFGQCIPGCCIVLGILRPHDKTEPSMMFVYDLGTTKNAASGILLAQFDDSGPLDKIIINKRVFDVKLLRAYSPWQRSEAKTATEGRGAKRACAGARSEAHKSAVLKGWEEVLKSDNTVRTLIAAASSLSWDVEKIEQVRHDTDGVMILLKYIGWSSRCVRPISLLWYVCTQYMFVCS